MPPLLSRSSTVQRGTANSRPLLRHSHVPVVAVVLVVAVAVLGDGGGGGGGVLVPLSVPQQILTKLLRETLTEI